MRGLTPEQQNALRAAYQKPAGRERDDELWRLAQAFGLPYSSVSSVERAVRRYVLPIVPATDSVGAADDGVTLWGKWLRGRVTVRPVVTVAHLCDVHAPYQDDRALSLAYQVLRAAQPDVVVVGSDFADLYLSSSFGVDPDRVTYQDELDCLERHWAAHVRDVVAAAPNAVLVYIWGNHERRLFRALQEGAAQFRRLVVREWVRIVRHAGRVWYLGETDQVEVGALRVEHGIRHSEHVSKQRLIDAGGQVSVMAGHVHRRTYYSLVGARYSVQGVTSGCLAQIPPHYQMRGQTTKAGREHEHGTCIATVDLAGTHVEFENVGFVAGQCFFRGQVLKVKGP